MFPFFFFFLISVGIEKVTLGDLLSPWQLTIQLMHLFVDGSIILQVLIDSPLCGQHDAKGWG